MNVIPSLGIARTVALVLTVAVGAAGATSGAAFGQDTPIVRMPDVDPPDVDEPDAEVPSSPGTDGSLVFHGNYCGPGSRGVGRAPVDALDAACMHHDACSPAVGTGLPPCSCNNRLSREASAVAHDPRTTDELRITAEFVAEGAKALGCRR